MAQLGVAWIMAVAVVGTAACRDEAKAPGSTASASPAAGAASNPAGPNPARMRSLKIGDQAGESDGAPAAAQADPVPAVPGRPNVTAAPTVLGKNASLGSAPSVLGNNSGLSQSSSGTANRQEVQILSSPRQVQVRQDGSGNTQVMNVDATGGSVSQRQSGSGNFQSMNVGITDNPPAPPVASKP